MYIFSYYFYFADKYYTYMISFMLQKNISTEDNLLSASPRSLTICDHNMPQTRDSE